MQSKEVLKDKFSEIFKDKLPDLKEEIILKFKEIEDTILKNYNPLYILGVVTANNLFCNPEKYSESTFKGKVESLIDQISKKEVDPYTAANEILGKILK